MSEPSPPPPVTVSVAPTGNSGAVCPHHAGGAFHGHGCWFVRATRVVAAVGVAAGVYWWMKRRHHKRRGSCGQGCASSCSSASPTPASGPVPNDAAPLGPIPAVSSAPQTMAFGAQAPVNGGLSLSPVPEEKHTNEFATVAKQYAEFRPHYPKELYAHISRYYEAHCRLPRLQAVDIGTGSGQNAVPLADQLNFQSVVGVDKSREQLANAASHPRVRYQVGFATETGLPSGQATLVTSAEAAHWFHFPDFFPEVSRLLAPEGVLALLGYPKGNIIEPVGAQPFFDTYFKALRESPYWPVECKYELLANEFTGVDFTPFTDVQRFRQNVTIKMTVHSLLSYARTFSAFANLRRSGDQWDPSLELERGILALPAIVAGGGLNAQLSVEFAYFVVLASRPVRSA